MSRLKVSEEIPFPQEEVFRTYRDEPEALAESLPRVKTIEPRRRESLDDGVVQTVTRWKPLDPDIPTLIRQYVDPDVLGWTILATWYEDDWICEWEVRTGFMEEAVRFSGSYSFEPIGDDSTQVSIEGIVSVDATKIPGVPGLVSGKLGDVAESFLVRLLEPTFRDVLSALKDHLSERLTD